MLARAGARVRLIDRAIFPRHKLCGDTLNPGALAVLDSLSATGDSTAGLGTAVRDRALPIDGMTVSGPGGVQVTGSYPRSLRGAALTRDVLDVLLLEAATHAGAMFAGGVAAHEPVIDENLRVSGIDSVHRSRRERISARVVVLADGRGSRIASALQLSAFSRSPRRWAFGAYFAGVTGMTAFGEMHVRPHGYLGIAPLPHGVVNVCVVREIARGRRPAVNRQRVIEDALAAEPWLRDRFVSASRISPVVSLGPLAVDARAAGVPGLLLAGDVAGFIDPMTGDGLRFALRGGVLAAAAALSELATGRPAHDALSVERAREFGTKWRLDRAMRAVAGSRMALGLATALSRRWTAPLQYLIGVAGDVDAVPRESSVSHARHSHNTEHVC
jgi:flavin-dependent dehydrogenase